MKVLSLFTGAGGIELGLEKAGFEISTCIEIDNSCRETLRKNRPKWRVLERGDIFNYKPEQILEEAYLEKGAIFQDRSRIFMNKLIPVIYSPIWYTE